MIIMKTLKTLATSTLLITALGASFIANAALITFTDRSAWRIAAGGGSGNLTEDFNAYVPSTSFITQAGGVESPPGGHPMTLFVDGTAASRIRANTSPSITTIFAFSEPVFAVGFDVGARTNITDNLDMLTSLGDATYFANSYTESTFFGLVYDDSENFTSILFHDFSNNGADWSLSDNWEAFSPVPVPVPAAAWLFGSGLVGLVGFARRKKALSNT